MRCSALHRYAASPVRVFAAAALAGLLCLTAQAQDDVDADLRACARIQTERARLACYDALLRGGDAAEARVQEGSARTGGAGAATEAPTAAPAPPPPEATRAPPAEAAEPSRRTPEAAAAGRAAAPEPARAPVVVDLESPAPAATPATPSRAGEPQGERSVMVVEVQMRTPLPALFKMQNGETWLQNDTGSLHHLQEAPFPARIVPGALGSYFLVPENRGRRIRIRQVD